MAMRRILVVFASTFFVQAAGMVTGVMTARLLGPEGRGILAQLLSWALVLGSLGGLSLSEAVIYRTAQRRKEDGPVDALRAGLTVATITGIITLTVGLATIPLTFDIGGQVALGAVLIAAIVIPTNQFSALMAAYYQARSLGRVWTAMRLASPITGLIGIAIFLTMRDSLSPAIFLLPQIIAYTLVIGMGLYFIRGLGLTNRMPTRAEMADLLRYSFRVHASSLGAQREHWDRLIVNYCISAFAMGQYAVASTLPAALMAIAVTLDMMLFPYVIRQGATVEVFVRPARAAIYFIVLVGASVGGACFLLIPTIFGKAFTPAVPIAMIMSMTYTVIGIRYIIGSGFKAMNMPFRHGRGDLIAFGATFVALAPAALLFGGIGAAFAALAIQIMVLGIGLNAFQRAFGMPWWKLFLLTRQDVAMAIALVGSLRRR